ERVLPVATRTRARDHELAVVLPHDGTGTDKGPTADHRAHHPGTPKARIEVSRCGPDPRGDCEDGKHERDDMAPAAFQRALPMDPLRHVTGLLRRRNSVRYRSPWWPVERLACLALPPGASAVPCAPWIPLGSGTPSVHGPRLPSTNQDIRTDISQMN